MAKRTQIKRQREKARKSTKVGKRRGTGKVLARDSEGISTAR